MFWHIEDEENVSELTRKSVRVLETNPVAVEVEVERSTSLSILCFRIKCFSSIRDFVTLMSFLMFLSSVSTSDCSDSRIRNCLKLIKP